MPSDEDDQLAVFEATRAMRGRATSTVLMAAGHGQAHETAPPDSALGCATASDPNEPCECGKDTATSQQQLIEQLAYAHLAYKERIRALCEKIDDDMLRATVAQCREEGKARAPHNDYYLEWANTLEAEIGFRYSRRRAFEVLDAGASSYCVDHDGDSAKCPPGSHGDDDD